MNTQNKFIVAAQGERIVILKPRQILSKEDALNLAAWLVALADISEDNADFKALLNAVQNT